MYDTPQGSFGDVSIKECVREAMYKAHELESSVLIPKDVVPEPPKTGLAGVEGTGEEMAAGDVGGWSRVTLGWGPPAAEEAGMGTIGDEEKMSEGAAEWG